MRIDKFTTKEVSFSEAVKSYIVEVESFAAHLLASVSSFFYSLRFPAYMRSLLHPQKSKLKECL